MDYKEAAAKMAPVAKEHAAEIAKILDDTTIENEVQLSMIMGAYMGALTEAFKSVGNDAA